MEFLSAKSLRALDVFRPVISALGLFAVAQGLVWATMFRESLQARSEGRGKLLVGASIYVILFLVLDVILWVVCAPHATRLWRILVR